MPSWLQKYPTKKRSEESYPDDALKYNNIYDWSMNIGVLSYSKHNNIEK